MNLKRLSLASLINFSGFLLYFGILLLFAMVTSYGKPLYHLRGLSDFAIIIGLLPALLGFYYTSKKFKDVYWPSFVVGIIGIVILTFLVLYSVFVWDLVP